MTTSKEQILKQYFGYDAFRPLQGDIIDNLLQGNDCFVLMPTGGGKSICFQVPALMKAGVAVVISPLLSLMKDQVEALRANGVSAAFINSSQTMQEQNLIEQQCKTGKIKLIYIAPEKLFTNGFWQNVKQWNVSFFAVDEAHCISSWGHDFRPEYTKLSLLKREFPNLPIIALTATADKVTRKDILAQLTVPSAKVFVASFDRPNLALNVLSGIKRLQKIEDFLKKHKNESGIIYCMSRKITEEVAEKMRALGFSAKHYHAGMPQDERNKAQEDFINDETQVICATIAFGMGIDKSNVRWVIHYNLPKNMEGFYQEIGRAGRDGMPADTLLFYSYADIIFQERLMQEMPADRKTLQMAKLERIKQYAETEICRRRILISYFNEEFDRDCGNCDVCKNPPTKFEATIIAQKALSAIARSDEKLTMTNLVNVLRGIKTQEVMENKWDQLKTFAAGRELKVEEWADYSLKLLNAGYIDVAYDEGHKLKLNNLSWQILKDGKQVFLTKFEPYKAKNEDEKPINKSAARTEANKDLFERLRILRKSIALEKEVPAFVVFSDKSLAEMATLLPTTLGEFEKIAGVGAQKLNEHGDTFIQEIRSFIGENGIKVAPQSAKLGGETQFVTLEMLKSGKSSEQIASERGLSPVTINSHLASLHESGHDIGIEKMITKDEFATIAKAWQSVGVETEALKPVYDLLLEKYPYDKIRLAKALIKRSW